MATPFRHRDETLTFFVFIQVNEALIHCRVIATKLKNCRVPSSDKKLALDFSRKQKKRKENKRKLIHKNSFVCKIV